MICHMCTTMLLGFSLITFYLKAFDRSWIMYPHFNHVDWAFFFALVSMGGNGFASYLYYQEVTELKHRMLKMKRLIVAAPNGGARSIGGGDIDSLDAVYATRSGSIYNQQTPRHDNQSNGTNKDASIIYPRFTQV